MIPVYHKACKPLFHAVYSNQKRHFSLVVSNNEVHKMQNAQAHNDNSYRLSQSDYHAQSPKNNPPAKHAQSITAQLGFIFFAVFMLALMGLFIMTCIENKLFSQCYASFMALIFDHITIKTHSYTAEILSFLVFGLTLWGLYCLIRFFTFYAALTAIIVAVAIWYYSGIENKPVESLKDRLVKEHRAKPFEAIGG